MGPISKGGLSGYLLRETCYDFGLGDIFVAYLFRFNNKSRAMVSVETDACKFY